MNWYNIGMCTKDKAAWYMEVFASGKQKGRIKPGDETKLLQKIEVWATSPSDAKQRWQNAYDKYDPRQPAIRKAAQKSALKQWGDLMRRPEDQR